MMECWVINGKLIFRPGRRPVYPLLHYSSLHRLWLGTMELWNVGALGKKKIPTTGIPLFHHSIYPLFIPQPGTLQITVNEGESQENYKGFAVAPGCILAGSKINEQQTERHGQESEHPQVCIGSLLDLQIDGLDLFREGEIGKPLQDEDHADDTEEEFEIDIFHGLSFFPSVSYLLGSKPGTLLTKWTNSVPILAFVSL